MSLIERLLARTPAAAQKDSTRHVEVESSASWWRSTLVLALSGSLLMWVALPPCDLWPLAWVAPLPWLVLIRRESLTGRRPYRAVWFAGFVFWLLAVHWIRLPHPANYLAWVALAFYLAFYVPVFVGLARVGVHQLRVPLVLVAPVVWTGLEYARAHLLSGFLMAALGHTQYRWIELIQISDLAGGYAVSFLVMFVAACLAQMLPVDGQPWRVWLLVAAGAAVASTLVYGYARSSDVPTRPGPTVALIQGNIAADWKADADKQREIMEQYIRLSERAREKAAQQHERLDMVVWPETMFRYTLVELGENFLIPPGLEGQIGEIVEDGPRHIAKLAQDLDTPVLLGVDVQRNEGLEPEDVKRFNAAQAADRSGKLIGRYDKMHLVMFGEYVPFATLIPGLYKLTPLSGGLTAGSEPKSFELDGVRYAPNICFETVLPHLIRQHVTTLADENRSPDVLVNLTNDAWFWGASELDMHLACGVFRAVECRKPLLVAANAGISAWIDSTGHIQAQSPRQQEDVILAHVRLDQRSSPYLTIGDWPAGICLAAAVGLAIVGWRSRRSGRRSAAAR